MTLTELDPKWVGYPSVPGRTGLALEFLCPVCATKDPAYRHTLTIPLANPIDGGPPLPPTPGYQARWTREGETFDTLTLKPSIHHQTGRWNEAEQKSVLETHWHGFITNGEIVTV